MNHAETMDTIEIKSLINELNEAKKELTEYHKQFGELTEKEPENIDGYYTLWNRYINELTSKEKELINLKESYSTLEDKILANTKKIKEETGEDIIKEKYGGNNDKTRKKYVEESLKPEKDKQHDLELRISYLKRRINYIKSLMSMQKTLLEYGGNQL